jgi:hypothetical protein
VGLIGHDMFCNDMNLFSVSFMMVTALEEKVMKDILSIGL